MVIRLDTCPQHCPIVLDAVCMARAASFLDAVAHIYVEVVAQWMPRKELGAAKRWKDQFCSEICRLVSESLQLLLLSELARAQEIDDCLDAS